MEFQRIEVPQRRGLPRAPGTDSPGGRDRGRLLDALLVLLACLSIAAFIATTPLSHDVSWYLVATRRWLDGAQLYRDIIEINPPLAFYETAAMLALPLSDKLSFVVTLALLAAGSAWWSRSLVERAGAPVRPLLAASLAALLAVSFDNYGQREHAMLVFALPYVWWSALRPEASAREKIAIGAFAFLGFGLKPYFLAIPAAMTLSRMIADRSLRPAFDPANLAIGALGLLYLLLAWILHPAYFDDILPMGTLVYFPYGFPVSAVLTNLTLLLALPLCLAGFAAGGGARCFSAALVGAVISYLVQFRGWGYHLVPVAGLSLVLAAWLLSCPPGTERPSPRGGRLVAALALGVALLPLLNGAYRPGMPYYKLRTVLAGAESALLVGENVGVAYPLVQELGIRHVSDYPALWPLPGATRVAADPDHPRRAEAVVVLDDTRRNLVDDFVASPPDVLVIDAREIKPYFQGPFDYLAFLGQDPRFAEAIRGYVEAPAIEPFRIFRRKPGTTAVE